MSTGSDTIVAAIENYAAAVLEDMGMELVEVQFRREGHGWVLRLYIDKEEGVNVDDCAAVSREISTWLDVEDLIEHPYNLEVSSPGLERPLRKLTDFSRFAGRRAKVKLRESLGGQKVFTGTIRDVDGERITLEVDGRMVSFEYEDMSKARLVL